MRSMPTTFARVCTGSSQSNFKTLWLADVAAVVDVAAVDVVVVAAVDVVVVDVYDDDAVVFVAAVVATIFVA